MVYLFGGLQVSTAEGEKEQLAPSVQASLLAYLAYFHSQWHRRDALIERFWPETAPESGRNRFRITLSRLRTRLATEALPAEKVFEEQGDKLRLSAHFPTDVEQLTQVLLKAAQTALAEERIGYFEEAAQLYTGSLLTGFDDLWITPERQRLEDGLLRALHLLVRELREQKRFDEAIHYARQALSLDPLREEPHRDLISLYLAVGRPETARKQFLELERRFREELGIAPSAQTSQLLRQAQEPPPPTLPSEPPQPPTAPHYSHLPRSSTRFVGRVQEQAQVQEALSSPGALVSLVGFGGFGKTRLALEVAQQFPHAFPFWVPLADVLGNDSLWSTLVGYLNRQSSLAPAPLSLPAEERLVALLKEQTSLLILDNTEHLNDETLDTVLSTLRARIPELRCLITSRRRLGLIDEQVIGLEPLNPTEANQLFADRASRIRTSFTLHERNEPAVTALCERLEGVPLAIEMAAARVAILTPEQILTRLNQRFKLLVNQNKDVPTRHRTLEATLEWSYNLLTSSQQRLLAQVSVVQGTWPLEMAEVLGDDVLDDLQALVDASLIQTYYTDILDEERMRYLLLETTRQYLERFLDVAQKKRTRQQLLAWAEAFIGAAQAQAPLVFPKLLYSEMDLLLQILTLALDDPENFDTCVELIVAIKILFNKRGTTQQEYLLLLKCLDSAKPPLQKEDRVADILATLFMNLSIQGGIERVKQIQERYRPLYLSFTSDQALGRLHNGLGGIANMAGDSAFAQENFQKAHLHLEKGQRYDYVPLINIADNYLAYRQLEEARETLAQIPLEKLDWIPRTKGIVTYLYGRLHNNLGELETARQYYRQALVIFEAIQERMGILRVRADLAALEIKRENYEEASLLAREAGKGAYAIDDGMTLMHCITLLIKVALGRQNPRRAMRLFGLHRAKSALLWEDTENERVVYAELRQRIEAALGGDPDDDYRFGMEYPLTRLAHYAFELPDDALEEN